MQSEVATVGCGSCGAIQIAEGGVCLECGSPLLVDLIVDSIPREERALFYAARALTGVGLEPLSYSDARQRLLQPGAILARGISGRRAAELAELLESLGARCRLKAAPPQRRIPLRVLAVAAVLLVSAAAAAYLVLARRDPPPPPAPSAPVAEAAESPSPEPRAAAPAALPAEAPGTLTPQKLAARVLPSVASLRSGTVVGAGFFIEPDVLITNAHVLVQGLSVEVRLDDGRELLGDVIARDDWLDLARVRVVGAQAPPLPIGDSTRLEAGERVAYVGTPVGLEFTIAEGRVSYPGRNYLGIAYTQVDGNINPGNSGGPLLDARGSVVGIVSMKVLEGEGIGLALAIEYALAPRTPDHDERWKKGLAKAEADNQREIDKLKSGSAEPQLIGAQTVNGSLIVLLTEHFNGLPQERRYAIEIAAGSYRCQTQAIFKRWSPFGDALAAARQNRKLVWMERNGLAREVFLGAGDPELDRCDRTLFEGTGYLALQVNSREVGRVPLDASTLQMARVGIERQVATRERDRFFENAVKANEEHVWRQRFRRARDRIQEVETKTRVAQRIVDAAEASRRTGDDLPAPDWESLWRARNTLFRAREDLEKAQDDLHELERQASFKAIPLEWRH